MNGFQQTLPHWVYEEAYRQWEPGL